MRELDAIGTYAGLDDSLPIKLDELRILQIEARAFLSRLRLGGRARKTASALSDAATIGGFTLYVGDALSIPAFVVGDATATGILTVLGFVASAALKGRAWFLRKSVERLETLQDEIQRHIIAAELAVEAL